MQETPVFSRIDTVVVRVRNRSAAVAWYRARLGLQLIFEDRSQGLAVFNVGRGASLSVWELRPDETLPGPGVEGTFPIFDAVDATAQRHELIARGVRTSSVRETPGARCFSIWDPDGNRLEVCEVLEPGRG
jgi:catechol 2,3-dioxygenase-like lactoylglutathione lyase family enzyme